MTINSSPLRAGIAAFLGTVVAAAATTTDSAAQLSNRTATTAGSMVASPPTPEDHPYPSAAYSALGSTIVQNSHLDELGWDEKQIAAFLDGVQAAFHGHGYSFDQRTKKLSDDVDREIQELERHHRRQELSTPAGLAQFMKEIRKKASMRQTDSGLYFRLMVPGGGSVRPRPQDTVVLSFQCMTADDMVPVPHLAADRLRVKVGDLLPGLAEGVQMMAADGRAMFLLPPSLSFGDGEWPSGVDKGMPLAFMVTLHEIVSADTMK